MVVLDEATVIGNRQLLRTLERERAAFAEERARLIGTICALAAQQPLANQPAEPRRLPDETLEHTWTATPEQEPAY